MKTKPKILLLIEPSRGYERALLRGIARYAQLHGPWIIPREAAFWENRHHRVLMSQIRSADGIIMRENACRDEILALGKPAAISNYATERIDGAVNIHSDHRAIGNLAASHLIERGFLHFGFCGYGRFFWSRQRYEGFRSRVEAVGRTVDCYDAARPSRAMPWEKEQAFVIDWLRSLPKPAGVMCCVDERSHQIAEACKAAGIAVPEDVAIVGVDNDEMICTLSSIPLSSVSLTAEMGGYEAASRLHQLINGRGSTRRAVMVHPADVVARTSTDVFAAQDPHISKAVRFIGGHCREILYVSDVARAAGLSRRVLEKRFRILLDRSVNEHIRQCRIRHICKLLTDTDMTISDIAIAMGLSDAAHIARFFKSRSRMSPAEYRRTHRL